MMGLALIGRGGPRPRRFAGVALAAIALAATAAPAAADAAPPANDAFAPAELLTGADATTTGTTVEATKETGEPNHGAYVGGHSVWYRWVAPFTGTPRSPRATSPTGASSRSTPARPSTASRPWSRTIRTRGTATCAASTRSRGPST